MTPKALADAVGLYRAIKRDPHDDAAVDALRRLINTEINRRSDETMAHVLSETIREIMEHARATPEETP